MGTSVTLIPTLSSCPDTSWTNLASLPSTPTSPSYFVNIRDWSRPDFSSYITDQLKDVWIASAVFSGLALLSLFALLIWRTVHASQERRHKRNHGSAGEAVHHSITYPLPFTPPRTRPDSAQPADRWHTRLSWCLRLGIVLFALASLGLSIWGMTTVDTAFVDEAGSSIDNVVVFTQGLSTRLDLLANNISEAVKPLKDVINFLDNLADSLGIVGGFIRPIVTSLENALKDVLSSEAEVRQAAKDVDTQVTQRIIDFKEGTYYHVNDGAEAYYITLMVLLGLCLGILLFVLAGALVGHTRPLVTYPVALSQLWVMLFFLGATALAMALGAANDGCPAAETVIVANAGTRWAPLTVYYLNPDSNSTLTDALREADIADVDQIMKQLNTISDLLDSVAGRIPGSIDALKQIINTYNQKVKNVDASVKDLLAYMDKSQVVPYYLAVKSSICCTAADQLKQVFVSLTALGWVMLVMCWVGMGLLCVLDRAVKGSITDAAAYRDSECGDVMGGGAVGVLRTSQPMDDGAHDMGKVPIKL